MPLQRNDDGAAWIREPAGRARSRGRQRRISGSDRPVDHEPGDANHDHDGQNAQAEHQRAPTLLRRQPLDDGSACNPISTNASTFTTKTAVSQTE